MPSPSPPSFEIGEGFASDASHLLVVQSENLHGGQLRFGRGDGAILDGVSVVATSPALRTSVIAQNGAQNPSISVFQAMRPEQKKIWKMGCLIIMTNIFDVG